MTTAFCLDWNRRSRAGLLRWAALAMAEHQNNNINRDNNKKTKKKLCFSRPGHFTETDPRELQFRNTSAILHRRCRQNTEHVWPRIKSVLFSNSSNSTSCRTNSDMSDPCQELSLWVSPFAVMDCRSWVMICQRREILIFPELHQVMPHCHRLLEILIAIICCCWWPQWDRGCPVDLGDNLLHHIVL